MSPVFFAWLGAAMVVFLSGSTALRAYVSAPRIGLLVAALVLYTLGNLIMVRLMRETGMAVAISISAVLQLVLAAAVGILLFGERPALLQSLGLALGVVAVALIVWPSRPI
jgi:glucose uptake protein